MEPVQVVVAHALEGVGTIRVEGSIEDLAVSIELHERLVKGPVVVGIRAAQTVGDVGGSQTVVVAALAAVGVAERTEPVAGGPLHEAELDAVVVADDSGLGGAA